MFLAVLRVLLVHRWLLPRLSRCASCNLVFASASSSLTRTTEAHRLRRFIFSHRPSRIFSAPMSVASPTTSHLSQMTGAQALVAALVRHGITAGFGIPSIHNIAVYEALRQTPEFHHWVVRHEQAAGYAADGFYRHSGQIAAILLPPAPETCLRWFHCWKVSRTTFRFFSSVPTSPHRCWAKPEGRCMKHQINWRLSALSRVLRDGLPVLTLCLKPSPRL